MIRCKLIEVEQGSAEWKDLRRGRITASRMADVLADQIIPCHADQMALAHVTQLMKDIGNAHSDSGFAGAGIAGERHVQGGRIGFQAHLPPRFGHQQ